MPRIRGKRLTLLIAGALPLLAEKDSSYQSSSSSGRNEIRHNNNNDDTTTTCAAATTLSEQQRDFFLPKRTPDNLPGGRYAEDKICFIEDNTINKDKIQKINNIEADRIRTNSQTGSCSSNERPDEEKKKHNKQPSRNKNDNDDDESSSGSHNAFPWPSHLTWNTIPIIADNSSHEAFLMSMSSSSSIITPLQKNQQFNNNFWSNNIDDLSSSSSPIIVFDNETQCSKEINDYYYDDFDNNSNNSNQAINKVNNNEEKASIVEDEIETDEDRSQDNGTTADGKSDEKLESSSETEQIDDATTTAAAAAKSSSSATTVDEEDDVKHVAVDYASKSVGALILDSSTNFQGTSNLLQKDRDKYAIVPCSEQTKYVVIGLSEDILVKQIVIANYERYSSAMKEIRLSGSATTALGRDNWVDLGTYVTANTGRQIFGLIQPTWARYLKFEFLSYYGDEYYCTVSQISVHGSTMLQGFHEQWNENDDDDDDDIDENNENVDDEVTEQDIQVDGKIEESGTSKVDVGEEELSESETKSKEKSEQRGDFAKNMSAANKMSSSNNLFDNLFDNCFISSSGGVCPTGREFEQKIRSFATTGNFSIDYDNSAAICGISSPICLSSRRLHDKKLAISVFSQRSSHHLKQSKAPSSRLARNKITGPMIMKTASSDDNTKSVESLTDSLSKASPVVQRIKNLIKTTSEIVNVEEMGNHLRRTITATESEKVIESNDEKIASTAEKTLKSQNEATTKTEDKTAKGEEVVTKIESANPSSTPVTQTDSSSQKKESIPVSTTDTDTKTKNTQPPEKVQTEHNNAFDVLQDNGYDFARIVQRYPSAKCLEKIDYAKFKAAHAKGRGGNAANAGAGNGPPHAMEPIFKKLSDEIKALQANLAAYDNFAKDTVSCYQSVMVEMLIEMDTMRTIYDERLTKLESTLHIATWIVAIQSILTTLFVTIQSILASLMSVLMSTIHDMYFFAIETANNMPEETSSTFILGAIGFSFLSIFIIIFSSISKKRLFKLKQIGKVVKHQNSK